MSEEPLIENVNIVRPSFGSPKVYLFHLCDFSYKLPGKKTYHQGSARIIEARIGAEKYFSPLVGFGTDLGVLHDTRENILYQLSIDKKTRKKLHLYKIVSKAKTIKECLRKVVAKEYPPLVVSLTLGELTKAFGRNLSILSEDFKLSKIAGKNVSFAYKGKAKTFTNVKGKWILKPQKK